MFPMEMDFHLFFKYNIIIMKYVQKNHFIF